MNNISFVIPVYNEEKRISRTLNALNELVLPRDLSLESVIFVNDGSTDATLKKLVAWSKSAKKRLRAQVIVISYVNNMGKGYAIKQGMLQSHADYTLFFDADMSTPLAELRKFLPAIEKKTDIIVGTRKNGKATVVIKQPWHRRILGYGFTALSNFVLQTTVTDFTCGFKAFSNKSNKQIFHSAHIKRWGYDAELLFLVKKFQYSSVEVPVLWSNVKDSKVNVLKDVYNSLMELLLIRWYDLSGKYAQAHRISPLGR